MSSASVDTAFARIAQPIDVVFDFMAEPSNLGIWALGAWNATVDATGLIQGASIKDGKKIFVRIVSNADNGLIDFHVGHSPDQLTPRIFARVLSAEVMGADNSSSALLMTALRTDDMDDERWNGLCATHAVEIDLIKSAIETGYDHRRDVN